MHPSFAKTMKRTAVGLLLLIATGERSTVKKHLPQLIERGLMNRHGNVGSRTCRRFASCTVSPIATSWTHRPSK